MPFIIFNFISTQFHTKQVIFIIQFVMKTTQQDTKEVALLAKIQQLSAFQHQQLQQKRCHYCTIVYFCRGKALQKKQNSTGKKHHAVPYQSYKNKASEENKFCFVEGTMLTFEVKKRKIQNFIKDSYQVSFKMKNQFYV